MDIQGDVRKQFFSDEKKLERHRQTFQRSQPVVFCVRCGSTTIDQNSLYELRCYECGTTMEWNARKFSIRRLSVGENDVVNAFETARQEPGK